MDVAESYTGTRVDRGVDEEIFESRWLIEGYGGVVSSINCSERKIAQTQYQC